MRVLLANNHMALLGGTETWTYTMAHELSRQGHEVDVFTFEPGYVSDMCKPFSRVVAKPDGKYDVLIINHHTCLEALQEVPGYKIFTSHGPAGLENAKAGADAYVSVSEETQRKLHAAGFDSTVIRQPIDLDRFAPDKELHDEPQRILALSKSHIGAEWVKLAAHTIGAEMAWLRGWDRARWDMPEQINNADIVVSCGRGAVEAMACGRAVLNFDYRLYNSKALCDGWVVPDTIDTIHSANYSGRGFGIEVDGAQQIADGLQYYSAAMGPANRKLAEEHHDVKNIARQYLALIQ